MSKELNNTSVTSGQRRAEIEAWWALIARILAFFLGGMILAYQAFFETQDRALLLCASVGLMGPMVAAAVAQVLAALRTGHYNGGSGGPEP